MPAKVPIELIRLSQRNGHSPSPLIVTPNLESPTAFCKNTTDFGIAAILAHLRGKLLGMPFRSLWHLEVCPTFACPIECWFCSYTERNQRGTSLSWPVLQKVLDDAEKLGAVGCYFSGGGDPLAHSKIVSAIDRAAQFSGVAIQTNAVLLDRLLKQGARWFNRALDLISWSIYAHDEASFARTCQSEPKIFQKMVENINIAVSFRDEWNREHTDQAGALPGVHISGKIVVHRDNYPHLPEILAFARGFNLDTYHFRLVDNFEPGQDVALTAQQLLELQDSISASADPILVSLRESLSRRSQPAAPCPPYSITEGHIAIVETDGSLYLSIPSDGNPEYIVGNVNSSSLGELWGSAQHLETIRRLRSFLAPLTKDRHHKNDLAIHEFLTSARQFHLTPEMLTARNFRLFQRAQL